MFGRPPRSTLFPYTTLSRSTSRGPVLFTQMRVGLDRRALSNAGGNTRRHTDQGGEPFTMYKFRTMRPANGNGKQVWAQPDEDRKSTRLNSSHLVISYAVFCL